MNCYNRHRNYSAILFAISGLLVSGCSTSFTDISPDTNSPTSGGMTIALAPGNNALFAVSLSAGLWRSEISKAGVRTWNQFAMPKYAHCVAVDPNQPFHVVTGDREGDGTDPRLNEAGIYESFDNGMSFTYVWNPIEMVGNGSNGHCGSQVIQAIVFSSKSTIVAATPCGIARRVSGSSDFNPSTLPVNTDEITNLTASQTKLWARTAAGLLLVSTDDGVTFDTATHKPLPQGTAWNDTGDSYSLAASDQDVIMSACCITWGPQPVETRDANELLIYDVVKDAWRYESFVDGAGKTSTEGVYLGGRRFVKAFQTDAGYQYFFCNGQHVWQSDLGGNHTLLGTSGADNPGTPLYSGYLHVDFWDFAVDRTGKSMWIACDGGVYENNSDGKGWTATVHGYHTQHVQSLDAFSGSSPNTLAYSTQDNSDWYGYWPNWQSTPIAGSGDGNFNDCDPAGDRREFFFHSRAQFVITSLDDATKSYSSQKPGPVYEKFADMYQPDTPGIVQFIKGIKGEDGYAMDALLIVHRPVMGNTAPPIPGSPIVPPAGLEGIEKEGNPWLLRNKKFEDAPDFYNALNNGNWQKELNDLPQNTYRVLVSNGHELPHYYAIVSQTPGLSALFERKTYSHVVKRPQWEMVFNGIIDWTNQCIQWEGWYGPVFVNPYDDSKIYVLAPDGVKVSHRDQTGALIFQNDDVLTKLITASGTYPIERQFCGGNNSHVLKGERMLGTSTLGQVSFFRDAPNMTLVTSPFTGAFFDNGDGKWRSFSNVLPMGYVWAGSLGNGKAYFGFAGRSIGMVDNIDKAPLATYFTKLNNIRPNLGGAQSIIAQLNVSDGSVASNATVSCRITGTNGKTIFWGPTLGLDNQGRVLVPLHPIPSGSIVHLHYTANDGRGLASSEFHFIM